MDVVLPTSYVIVELFRDVCWTDGYLECDLDSGVDGVGDGICNISCM